MLTDISTSDWNHFFSICWDVDMIYKYFVQYGTLLWEFSIATNVRDSEDTIDTHIKRITLPLNRIKW